MFDFEYNGDTGREHGLLVMKRPDIPPSAEEMETFKVAGRDGLLTGETRIYSRDITVDMNFKADDAEQWQWRMRDLRKWLSGSGVLKLSDDPEWFYKVSSVRIASAERNIKRYGKLQVTFTCDPYVYSLAGQKEYDHDDERVLQNDYDVCHPLYIFPGSGTQTLTVNGHTVTITGSGALVVDTDRMIAYTQTTRDIDNTRVAGDYEDLYLKPGTNTIASSGPLKIIPNWRCR